MIEKLRNQEALSIQEERRIEKWIRISILIAMALVIAVILWAALGKKSFGTAYYVSILVLLGGVWFVKYVLAAILEHSLAQRTDEQVGAYLKAAGLEALAYAGLGWFLLAMSGNAIIGAVIYMIGVTGARKQKDIYYQTEEDAQDTEHAAVPEEIQSAPEEAEAGPQLPSAADRQEREKEPEDGSV